MNNREPEIQTKPPTPKNRETHEVKLVLFDPPQSKSEKCQDQCNQQITTQKSPTKSNISNKFLSLTCNLDKFTHLGFPLPLYLNYFQGAILIILGVFVIFGLFNFITNISSTCDSANQNSCGENWLVLTSLTNKGSNQVMISVQSVLCLVVVLFLLLSTHLLQLTNQKMLQKFVTQSEYCPPSALVVSGIPQDRDLVKFRASLEKKMEDVSSPRINITDVCETFDIHDAFSIIRKKKIAEISSQNADNNGENSSLTTKIAALENKFQEIQSNTLERSKIVLITLANHQQLRCVLNQAKNKSCFNNFIMKVLRVKDRKRLAFNGKQLSVLKAPEPDTIIWENIGRYSTAKRWITILLSVFLIAIEFGILIGLEFVIKEYDTNQNRNTYWLFSFLSAAVLLLMNAALTIQINFSTIREGHWTLFDYYSSISLKATMILSTNLILAPLLARLAVRNDPNGSAVYFFITIIKFCIDGLESFLRIVYSKRILSKRAKLKARTDNCIPAFSPWKRFFLPIQYTKISTDLIFTLCISPLLPLVMIINAFKLFFIFWSEKYYLLNFQSENYAQFGKKLSQTMISLLLILPLSFVISNLVFTFAIADSTTALQESCLWVSLVISLLNCLIPLKSLNKILFRKSYQQPDSPIAAPNTCYSDKNPITSYLQKYKTSKDDFHYDKEMLTIKFLRSALESYCSSSDPLGKLRVSLANKGWVKTTIVTLDTEKGTHRTKPTLSTTNLGAIGSQNEVVTQKIQHKDTEEELLDALNGGRRTIPDLESAPRYSIGANEFEFENRIAQKHTKPPLDRKNASETDIPKIIEEPRDVPVDKPVLQLKDPIGSRVATLYAYTLENGEFPASTQSSMPGRFNLTSNLKFSSTLRSNYKSPIKERIMEAEDFAIEKETGAKEYNINFSISTPRNHSQFSKISESLEVSGLEVPDDRAVTQNEPIRTVGLQKDSPNDKQSTLKRTNHRMDSISSNMPLKEILKN